MALYRCVYGLCTRPCTLYTTVFTARSVYTAVHDPNTTVYTLRAVNTYRADGRVNGCEPCMRPCLRPVRIVYTTVHDHNTDTVVYTVYGPQTRPSLRSAPHTARTRCVRAMNTAMYGRVLCTRLSVRPCTRPSADVYGLCTRPCTRCVHGPPMTQTRSFRRPCHGPCSYTAVYTGCKRVVDTTVNGLGTRPYTVYAAIFTVRDRHHVITWPRPTV